MIPMFENFCSYIFKQIFTSLRGVNASTIIIIVIFRLYLFKYINIKPKYMYKYKTTYCNIYAHLDIITHNSLN